jgi:hypothetical protein
MYFQGNIVFVKGKGPMLITAYGPHLAPKSKVFKATSRAPPFFVGMSIDLEKMRYLSMTQQMVLISSIDHQKSNQYAGLKIHKMSIPLPDGGQGFKFDDAITL